MADFKTNYFQRKTKPKGPRSNNRITSPDVQVIGHDGENLGILNLNDAMVQKFPTFRVMLPNNVAIVVKHHDTDDLHKHPTGEINFIMGLTDMYDSNTVHVEKMPRLDEYVDITLNKGETICFNGNKCNHYNEINKTGNTRVSFDFRILPMNYYNDNYNKTSASTNTKYIEGGYYKRIKII